MSHYFCRRGPLASVAPAVLVLAGRMMTCPASAPLVAGRRPPQLFGAAGLLALPQAVRLTPIARAADPYVDPAAPALKEPKLHSYPLPAALDSAGGGRHKGPAASPTGAPQRRGPGVEWCRARALALSAGKDNETAHHHQVGLDGQQQLQGEYHRAGVKPARWQRGRQGTRPSTAGSAGPLAGCSGPHRSGGARTPQRHNASADTIRPRITSSAPTRRSGPTDYFWRAEAGSFWIAPQWECPRLPDSGSPVPSLTAMRCLLTR